jgi:hypothetical protein
MNDLNLYTRVRYIGPFDRDLVLASGEIGTVLEDYGDGNFELEFSFPDGSTWLQCALPLRYLEPAAPSEANGGHVPSRDAIFPAIIAFERGDDSQFFFTITGERLFVRRDNSDTIVVETESLGALVRLVRPRPA